MPRSINQKCLACSKLQKPESREHACWVEKTCSRKRTYYLRRDKELEESKRHYARSVGKPIPQKFDLNSEGIYRAELVIYGQEPDRNQLVNGGVNAIAFNIYQGKHKVYESHPLPTQGLLAYDLEELIDRGMAQLRQEFDIQKLGRIVWQDKLPKDMS